jgi:hypothetical protein
MPDFSFKEGKKQFKFSNWENVIQFDKNPDYKKISDILPNTKGVDFLGILKSNSEKRVCFLEIKDFRNYEKENASRTANAGTELMMEIAQKVRDSLSCITAGSRNSTNDLIFWREVLGIIQNTKHSVYCILWLEENLSYESNENSQKRYKSQLNIYQNTLKQKLSWLGAKVFCKNKFPELGIIASDDI